MKKHVVKICLFFVMLLISVPVLAACPEESGTVSLSSNNLLNGFRVHSYVALGALQNGSSSYGVSTFNVRFDSRRGTSYYGYCLDPGFSWDEGDQQVCCSAVQSNKYSKGVRAGLIYLAKTAGDARRYHGTNSAETTIADIALRFYAMANNLSLSSYTNSGSAFYQLTNYLQKVSGFYRQGQIALGNDHEAINKFVKERLRDTIYSGYTLQHFVTGNNAEEYVTKAYKLFTIAMDKKREGDNTSYFGSNSVMDVRINGTSDDITCAGNNLIIGVETESTVRNIRFQINGENLPYEYRGGNLIINKNNIFGSAKCNGSSGDVIVSILASYQGGKDEDLYICEAIHGPQKQQILTYVGAEGRVGDANSTKTASFVLTIPSNCVPNEYSSSCLSTGGKRCGPSSDQRGSVSLKIKSSINNCCHEQEESNTSTVVDAMSFDNSLELNIDNLFVKNIKLRRDDLYSVVRCGTQSLAYAPDFRVTRGSQADETTMKRYCAMYCMERSRIITPPPVTVTAGRYFEIDFSKFDIQERRACRVSVDWSRAMKEYTEIVVRQKNAFNEFYKNRAPYELYHTVFDNVGGYYHHKTTKKVTIVCKRKVGKVYCDANSSRDEPNCTSGVETQKTLSRTCDLTFDELAASLPIKQKYPIITAYLDQDVGWYEGVGEDIVGYERADTRITATTRRTGYADYKRQYESKYRFFAHSYDNEGCLSGQSPYELAGSPNCYCGGDAIPPLVEYEETYECECDGSGHCQAGTTNSHQNNVPGWTSGHTCTRTVTLHNTYYTAAQNSFTCSINAEGQDLIDYVTNEGRGYYPLFDDDMRDYLGKANAAQAAYQAALNTLVIMEESMRECLHYFDEEYYGGNTFSNHYDVSKIATSFEYDQIYSTTSGGMTVSTIYGSIDHECTVSIERKPQQYDGGFQTSGVSSIKLAGFHISALPYKVASFDEWFFGSSNVTYWDYIINYTGGAGKATGGAFPKYVTLDAVYVVNCKFKDRNNEFYTLVPGGYPNLNPVSDNYVSHEKLLPTYLTTYAGKHEILYHISGLGSQIARQFDTYFQKGLTCSNRNSGAYNAPASCYFNAVQKLVTTGVCNEVASASNYDQACYVSCAGDGSCSSIYNFVFKISEPNNLFPNELPDLSDPNGWGKNWLTNEGINTRNKIEHDAGKDLTYSPENLTYSYVLSAKTIEAIKEYNNYRYDDGGYNDFGLSCNCGTNGSKACVKCMSTFLSNLAQRSSVETISTSYVSDDPIWANTDTIQYVRDHKLNWNKSDVPAKAVLYHGEDW